MNASKVYHPHLKNFQNKAIGQIDSFLQSWKGANNNVRDGYERHYLDIFPNKEPDLYHAPKAWRKKDSLKNHTPAVTLQAPTGAGKTVMSIVAIQQISRFLKKEKGADKGRAVLFLAPNDKIIEQTYKSFKNPKAEVRDIIKDSLGDEVKVMEINKAVAGEFISSEYNISDDGIVVFVGSIQSLRAEDREKRKAYSQKSKRIASLYTSISGKASDTEMSFFDLCKKLNPIIVTDESHQTSSTELAWDVLADLKPSFVLQMSATPRPSEAASPHVVAYVTVQELKDEGMVRLPLGFEPVAHGWKSVLNRAIEKREALEKIAEEEKVAIRPMVLVECERKEKKDNQLSVEDVKEYLVNSCKIPPEEVAISVAGKDELKGTNPNDFHSPIRYAITVKKLAEGWDCSFAMILVKARRSESRTHNRQLIGRILRQHKGVKTGVEELDKSYVFASNESHSRAFKEVLDELQENGFSEYDVQRITPAKEQKPKSVVVQSDYLQRLKSGVFNIPVLAFKNKNGDLERLPAISDISKWHKIPHDLGPIANLSDIDIVDEIMTTEFDVSPDGEGLSTFIKEKKAIAPKEIERIDLEQELTRSLMAIQWLKHKERKELAHSIINDLENKGWSLSDISSTRSSIIDNVKSEMKSRNIKRKGMVFEKSFNDKDLGVVDFQPTEIFNISPGRVRDNYIEKHLYDKLPEGMNSFEIKVLEKIAEISGIKAVWAQLANLSEESFYLPYEEGRYYPDFIVWLRNGTIVIIEGKGEHLVKLNKEQRKLAALEKWQALSRQAGYLVDYFFVSEKRHGDKIIALDEVIGRLHDIKGGKVS